jgi:uncharacterized membrane protein
MKFKSFLILSLIAIIFAVMPARAQQTQVVQIVFFYNPDCENCHLVKDDILPPLKAQYGSQLEILEIDTTQPEGLELYRAMSRDFKLTGDRLGTPAIVVGESVLVGVDEIPAKLPGLIKDNLSKDGVSWPEIPGLAVFIAKSYYKSPYPEPQVYPQPVAKTQDITPSGDISTWEKFSANYKKDPIANSLAVVILAGMIISILMIMIILVRSVLADNPKLGLKPSSSWLIPLLLLIGLGVAGYLSYIEVGEKQAICGPIGNCNEVQNSAYAKLFGILPIGVLGMIGYITMLIAWGVWKFGPKKMHMLGALALWGMSLFGIAFSIYLTFLEPFVIGATCMWCLSSALVMTALLWVSTPILQEALTSDDIADEDQLELLDA